ncbi:membrane protein [Pseudoxanthomonas suwonensis]|uniref:Membrane protein n=2 Tax=Pseudoxanthomonas suwonensis TaxID=314722 RepID=A0A0E3UPL7_9GAMM|nr:membrane protein [Pseudoxanthomonas suwonensis]
MREWLYLLSEPVIAAIDLMALLLIACATLHVFIRVVWLVLKGQWSDGHERRALWLGYARWLVAGLTFQLAADIVESSVAPSWEAIGQLGAVAVIRTFLNYFLERDLAEVRERELGSRHEAAR